ncbi:methyl farnesoate epoxidase-like [Macrosteles quadrilineatus]|uniref:methyl farnesoate epoxidase-like n=1 Tax=Macrosteles quadrilineatus TaxID=74068 RepID=UPI0023E0A78C|nr:methyl farnesoate epoxidase-like [Macrosteles quadrilineatus]
MYGPLVGLRLGRDCIVLVSGYPLVKETLQREEFEGRPDGFLFRLRAFGKRLGIVFTDGELGQEQRRFVLRHLRELGLGRSSMQDRIINETKQFITCLREKCEDGPVNVRRVVNVCILNNLWGMLAGKRFCFNDKRLSQLLNYIHQSFSLQDMSGGLLNQMPFIRYIAPERSTYNKNLEILSNTYSFLTEMIEEHKKTLNPNHTRDFIDAFLIEIKKNENNKDSTFTEEQLLVLLMDLFMAGSDSTSNTLSFTILYLLHFPRIHDRVLAEIEEVVGNCRPPSLQDKPNMPYTEALIMEVLRFTNIATVTVPHRAKQQVLLDSYIIPKDVTLLVSLYSVHMDPDHWGDPQNFRPERFLDAEGNVKPDDWLIPFGLGRRRCLGETLARPMLFLFLTSLLFHFRVSLPPGAALPSYAPVDGAILAPPPFSCVLTPRF